MTQRKMIDIFIRADAVWKDDGNTRTIVSRSELPLTKDEQTQVRIFTKKKNPRLKLIFKEQ